MHGTFVVFGIEFPAYFTLLMVGFMAGTMVAWKAAPSLGIDPNKILDLAILIILAGVGGGRIAHVLFDGQLNHYYWLCKDPLQTTGEILPGSRYCIDNAQCTAANLGDLCHPSQGTCHWGKDCLRVFKFWDGGLTYYGGLLLAIPLGLWFLRRNRIPQWKVADLAGIGIPLGLGFGRLGCFLSGCCYGQQADVGWAVSFPNGSPAWKDHYDRFLVGATDGSLPVHPTQLYESLACFAIAGLMMWWYKHKKTFDGEILWLFVLLYGMARFMVETLRGDERGEYFGLSTSEGISLVMIVMAIFFLSRLWKRSQAQG